MKGKFVVTVIGGDKTGIVASVSTKLRDMNINIVDISQTIFENEIFAMVMLAETEKDVTMKFVQDELTSLEDEIAVKIFAQHEDIFNAMHRI